MSVFKDGYHKTDHRGVTTSYVFDDDGNLTVNTAQDVEAVLEANKAQSNEITNKSDDMWHAARIPTVVQLKWLLEEGLDIYNPEHAKRVAAKLNSNEWRHLRTGHFQL